MADSHTQPSASEARELLVVLELGAVAAGARASEVDDIVQAIAEHLVVNWTKTHVADARRKGPAAWHNYLRRAAKNKMLDLRRSDRRRAWREARSARGNDGEPLHERPGVKRRPVSEASDVDRYLARRMLVDSLDECGLKPAEREVAALDLVDGLTTAEIAERLGKAVRTVNALKREARAKLQQHLVAQPMPDSETSEVEQAC